MRICATILSIFTIGAFASSGRRSLGNQVAPYDPNFGTGVRNRRPAGAGGLNAPVAPVPARGVGFCKLLTLGLAGFAAAAFLLNQAGCFNGATVPSHVNIGFQDFTDGAPYVFDDTITGDDAGRKAFNFEQVGKEAPSEFIRLHGGVDDEATQRHNDMIAELIAKREELNRIDNVFIPLLKTKVDDMSLHEETRVDFVEILKKTLAKRDAILVELELLSRHIN